MILASALNNSDFAFEYVSEEKLDDGSLAHHIRFWNTYASRPRLQHLAEFSVKGIWIDAISGLPRKLTYQEREARGDAPSVAVGAVYSDWRNVGGVLYPFLIERIFNRTPWATIRIDNVTLNAGVSDADLSVQ